jgi:hypothetical protein
MLLVNRNGVGTTLVERTDQAMAAAVMRVGEQVDLPTNGGHPVKGV